MEAVIVIGFVLLIAAISGAKMLKNLIYVCGPNEVLVFSGGRRNIGRRTVGYRTVKGGRRVRIPLLETVDRLELTNMIIEVLVTGAYSKGGIPLNVQGVANVKIAGDQPILGNALERILGKSRGEVMKIAKETLEGNLRGVLATLTPEQVNEDKMAFAQSLLVEAEQDLHRLGLTLDNLKIQNVTDDQGYLQSIGRKQNAELIRRARIAEANAKAEAIITAAHNKEKTTLAQIGAQKQIARAEAERRIVDATTKRGALVAEQETEVTALIAKSKAEIDVQSARIEQVRRQLEAEVIAPATAHRDAKVYEARGQAAEIVEDGRARADALRELTQTWFEHGDTARRTLILQKLDRITGILLETLGETEVESFTVIDGAASQLSERGTPPMRAISSAEQIKDTLGIDLAELAEGLAAARSKDRG